MGWLYLDTGVMTSDAAGTLTNVLVVVLFAYLVEVGALIRAARSAEKDFPKTLMLANAMMLALVALNFSAVLVPLLAIQNGAVPSHDAISNIWVGAFTEMIAIAGNLGVLFFIVRAD